MTHHYHCQSTNPLSTTTNQPNHQTTMSKRSKRVTRNSKKAAIKTSEQLCMTVTDHGATISSSNAQNHFGFAPFSLTINVEPQIHDLEPQPLSVQLVFEDGQQIDTESNQNNNIKFRTSPKNLFIDSNGSCDFTVHIETYSMFHDNRAFKLVFNLGESATRHIRPCETKPFRLVYVHKTCSRNVPGTGFNLFHSIPILQISANLRFMLFLTISVISLCSESVPGMFSEQDPSSIFMNL